MPEHELGPEEEYFLREDLEKLKALRARRDGERRRQAEEHQKKLHWMKCPKCGANLHATTYRDVVIDVCENCRGVYLDQGELEILLGSKDSAIGRFFKLLKLELNYGPVSDGPGGLEKK